MITIDTNVVVRLLIRDDPEQTDLAARAIRGERLWLSKTVLLESEWVLRFSYRKSAEEIQKGFRSLLGYPRLEMEDRRAVLRALDRHRQGLDFADALHLASSRASATFVTFDRTLASAAEQIAGGPKVELLQPR